MIIYEVKTPASKEKLYVQAEFLAAGLQKARRLVRTIFNSTERVKLTPLMTPTADQELVAAQMACLLGERYQSPALTHKVAPAAPQKQPDFEGLWQSLTQEINRAGLSS